MEESLTILYTANLNGDLHLLPRLFSQIAQLRQRVSGRVVLIDLGGACSDAAWHCAITNGRSMLVALDGMGYDAANVDGFAPPDVRESLGENVRMEVVNSQNDGYIQDIYATIREQTAHPHAALTIFMAPQAVTALTDGLLHLQSVDAGQIGMARLHGQRLMETAILALPASAQPDPTIAGIVEFIEAEARYAQKKRERQGR